MEYDQDIEAVRDSGRASPLVALSLMFVALFVNAAFFFLAVASGGLLLAFVSLGILVFLYRYLDDVFSGDSAICQAIGFLLFLVNALLCAGIFFLLFAVLWGD